ncbi:hypothetical protein DM02DRAFT_40073 [Periconia macrospinosa]|uniref:Uncharacterized protein n=1 Tax=Periconia macrospinosa TaxID=97972 RepID=A0A2V1DKH8_9PLEO|nr:hypothetical protein DM02DRAFT_40073 [Periconia macrospinosa]
MRRRHTGILGVYYAWIQGRAGSDGDVAEFDGRTRWWRFMCRNNCDFELDGAGHFLNIVENRDKVCPDQFPARPSVKRRSFQAHLIRCSGRY